MLTFFIPTSSIPLLSDRIMDLSSVNAVSGTVAAMGMIVDVSLLF